MRMKLPLALSMVLLASTQLPAPNAADHCGSSATSVPPLSTVTAQAGQLAPGEATCFSLRLKRGELVRIAIHVEIGYVRGRVLSPSGTELQRTWTSSFALAAPSPMLTIEAGTPGIYLLELSVPTWVGFTNSQAFRVHLSSRESAAMRSAKRTDLQRDPRVAWLRANAQRLRTVQPSDPNFSDLEFLRDILRETRVVLLGEGDNGGGSDVLAKTRLVKFLHERMGFDVIAFQANAHSSSVAWRALQTDANPRDAVAQALFGLLSRSAEAEALFRYLAAQARSSHPLELTGFDSQFTGNASVTMLPELQAFLRRNAPNSVLLDTSALATRVLTGTVDGRFARDSASRPSEEQQAQAVEILRAEARDLESRSVTSDYIFWTQVLRSAATQVDLMLNSFRGAPAREYLSGLVRQLGDNLVWLVNTRYPNHKVIVWTHTFHAMRGPEVTSHGRATGHTVGQAVWDVVGQQSFAIGLTSYDGISRWITQPDDYYQSIIPNQHAGDAFETLMAAAGQDAAFVNLRAARARHEWLGGRFVSNALYMVPEEAEWSKALDALLFVRTQDPRHRAR